MNVAFLFLGQGSPVPGVLHTLPDHPTISRTLDEVSETLKQNVLQLDEVKLPENLQCVFARKFRRKRFYLNIRIQVRKPGSRRLRLGFPYVARAERHRFLR